MAGSLAACETVYMRGVLEFSGFNQKGPTTILMDSSTAISISADPVMHDKSRHILRRELHIRELVDRGVVQGKYIKSAKNPSDIFTKYLEKGIFNIHCDKIFNA